jgi:hypothetical protein
VRHLAKRLHVLFGGTGEATDQNATRSDEAGEADLLASASSTLLTSHRSGSDLQADSVPAVGTNNDLESDRKKADNEAFSSGSGRIHQNV